MGNYLAAAQNSRRGSGSATISADLLLRDAEFAGDVDLQALRVDGDVLLPRAKFEADLDLRHATIGLALGMHDIRVRGCLVMDRAHSHSIALRKAECGSIAMRYLEVEDVLDFTGAKLSGPLDLESSQIGGDVFLQGEASFRALSLADARVRGTIVARRAMFQEKFRARGVGAGYVWLHADARFEDGLELKDAHIDANIDLGESHIERQLDLAGCKIGSTLVIGSVEYGLPTWGPDAEMILHDATARTLQVTAEDSRDATWPSRIALGGFIYEQIGGSDQGWLDDWLACEAPHSAQAYRQAARVLTEQGDVRHADRILFAGRERQRKSAPPLRQVVDWIAKLTIGYGIGSRYFRSLGWAALLASIGACVFAPGVHSYWNHPGASVLFSLDELLPIIDVSPGADDIAKHLTGEVHWYLAFHRAAGFLLGTFIVAGLTGLTKK